MRDPRGRTRFEELVEVWDELPAAEAVCRAWLPPGPKAGTWHRNAKTEIERLMPLLARALDRLVVEEDVYPVEHELWDWPTSGEVSTGHH